ncbi:MAG: DUF309 domain-containing protein [Myxococcales bacterium]|nr:DUF309 domain-containing protein [Myxococcales bacterium]
MARIQDGPEQIEHHERHPRDRLGRPLPKGTPNELPMPVEPGELASSPAEAFGFAALLFDLGRFFEAHEFFEYLWKSKATREEDRAFWQGVTQLAAALCHLQRHNRPGAFTLLGRATENLRCYPSVHLGVDNRELQCIAREAAREIKRGQPVSFTRFPLAKERSGRMDTLLAATALAGIADAVWMAAHPKSWCAFWSRALGGIGNSRAVSWPVAAIELGLSALFLVRHWPRPPAAISAAGRALTLGTARA